MQEVLSQSDDPKGSLKGQEFYELRLYDSDSTGEPVFYVREAHAWWDDLNKQIAWDDPQIEAFATLEGSQKRYAERRLSLARIGFIYSDMDLI